MTDYLTSLWHEPRVADAPGPLARDWLLVAAISAFAAAEAFLRQDLSWPLLAFLSIAVLSFTLPWRRVHPGPMVFAAFGLNALGQTVGRLVGIESTGLAAGIFMLILPYSLLRWGSGREVYAGLAVVFATYLLTILPSGTPWGEVVGGLLFLLFPAALGASVRFRVAAERRARDQVRLRERERLARELHDTVAHHVSAIAIRAQAGKALAAQNPDAPLDALEVIESAASHTLTEMRRIVRALRSEGDAVSEGLGSIADIQRLAEQGTPSLDIEVQLTGELSQLDAALENTLYRITQESITNTVRHAQHADSLTVNIHGGVQEVHLRVQDNGRAPGRSKASGFGLLGMMERAVMLGGRFSAGPGETRGWVVDVVLPRNQADV